jgi:hypothetical protein
MSLSTEGTIEKQADGSFIVRVQGKPYLSSEAGVVCENPQAKPEDQIHSKVFTRKRIFLPNQYKEAVQSVLTGNDVVVLAMNGYSSITPEKLLAWGVRPGAYEAACEGILKSVYQSLTTAYPGIDIRFADGASPLGVDKAVIKTARDLNRPHLGHSCPRFMFYVQDDEDPVYVADSQAAYAEAFIDSLHLLIAANGRKQAFEHDIDAVFKKLKQLITVNVLRAISTTGGPPATDGKGNIEDAVACFEQRVHMMGQRTYAAIDTYSGLVGSICERSTDVIRPLLSPERAFGNTAPAFTGRLVG